MKLKKQPSRKRTKKQQAAVSDARRKMKEKVVESKKNYKRRPKHRGNEE